MSPEATGEIDVSGPDVPVELVASMTGPVVISSECRKNLANTYNNKSGITAKVILENPEVAWYKVEQFIPQSGGAVNLVDGLRVFLIAPAYVSLVTQEITPQKVAFDVDFYEGQFLKYNVTRINREAVLMTMIDILARAGGVELHNGRLEQIEATWKIIVGTLDELDSFLCVPGLANVARCSTNRCLGEALYELVQCAL